MSDSKGKGKRLLNDPDDNQGLIIAEDWETRSSSSVVGLTESPFAFTSLHPIRQQSTTGTGESAVSLGAGAGDEAQTVETQRNLFHNHQAHIREDPIEFGKQLSLWATGSGWRSYTGQCRAYVFL
jgi:hypothetical protein